MTRMLFLKKSHKLRALRNEVRSNVEDSAEIGIERLKRTRIFIGIRVFSNSRQLQIGD